MPVTTEYVSRLFFPFFPTIPTVYSIPVCDQFEVCYVICIRLPYHLDIDGGSALLSYLAKYKCHNTFYIEYLCSLLLLTLVVPYSFCPGCPR